MRILSLVALPLVIGSLIGCSCPNLGSFPHYSTEAPIGEVPVDFAEGPLEVELHMEMILEAPERMSCDDLSPEFRLSWEGDDGDVRLQIATDTEVWEEDALAESGVQLTWIFGAFDLCTFDATVLLDGDESMAGELFVTARVVGGEIGAGASQGVLQGSVGAMPY